MKTIKCQNNLKHPILGVVTKEHCSLFRRSKKIFIGDSPSMLGLGYEGILSTKYRNRKSIIVPDDDIIASLNNGDILYVRDNEAMVLWDDKSTSNCIFLTPACNCKCMMCPQPPKSDDSSLHDLNLSLLSLLASRNISELCITGGEPFLYRKRLIEILKFCTKRMSDTRIIILTNGTLLDDFELVKETVCANRNILFCVSFHSDIESKHDAISGLNKSYIKTINGIHNLVRFNQLIEIRHVIHKENFLRLPEFSNFIFKNFPFIIHFAFMGLEVTGCARDNYDNVWIDPTEYAERLTKAVQIAHRGGINTSIYNIPLCLLPDSMHRFAKQSISEWKNDYLEECSSCILKASCCGIFTTSGKFQSKNIGRTINLIS